MTAIVCRCGAVYRQTMVKATFRDKESFQCILCGRTLASWDGQWFPTFELVSRVEETRPARAEAGSERRRPTATAGGWRHGAASHGRN